MGNDRSKLLEAKIRELEGKIEQLRFSRRVLMNLIERIEKEKYDELSKLEKENRKLQQSNTRYARKLLNKNRQIIEMETKLQIFDKKLPTDLSTQRQQL